MDFLDILKSYFLIFGIKKLPIDPIFCNWATFMIKAVITKTS